MSVVNLAVPGDVGVGEVANILPSGRVHAVDADVAFMHPISAGKAEAGLRGGRSLGAENDVARARVSPDQHNGYARVRRDSHARRELHLLGDVGSGVLVVRRRPQHSGNFQGRIVKLEDACEILHIAGVVLHLDCREVEFVVAGGEARPLGCEVPGVEAGTGGEILDALGELLDHIVDGDAKRVSGGSNTK